jgi:ABC-type uncharacterized transport system substrate-binding protein
VPDDPIEIRVAPVAMCKVISGELFGRNIADGDRPSGKWLELLKQIAPSVKRAAVIRHPTITAGIGQFGVIQSVAQSLGVEVSPVNVRDPGEIERAVAAFARSPNAGLILTGSPFPKSFPANTS